MIKDFVTRHIQFGSHGEKYSTLIRFFLPEFITNFLLYAMPFWIDSTFVASLASTDYAALTVSNSLLHLCIKIGEALSIGTLVLSGQFNGRNSFEDAGRALRDAFWTTMFLGLLFAGFLFFGARMIYSWFGVSDDIVQLGVPFLRLRAIGTLCMFIYMALIGFLKGIKNTRTPMQIFIIGSFLFVFFDYVLIFGKWGFPAMGLCGSALATVIQYGSMMVIALVYILFNKEIVKYSISLFSALRDISYVKHLFFITWPVFFDKAIMAMGYVWLGKMVATMGTTGIAAFGAVKDIERFAFLPAIAFAQVITFLVSNDVGIKNWEGVKANIKRVLFLSCIMVTVILGFCIYFLTFFISFLDKTGSFSATAIRVFPLVSIFIFFDLLQLILSGALRGSGNVRIVMIVRLATCFGYFIPLSYILSRRPFQDEALQLIALYGSFLFGNALMSIWYIRRFRSNSWKKHK